MNHYSALASMLGGVATFVLLSELTRLNVVELPWVLDPLMVSLIVGIGSLVLVARMTEPSPAENEYFDFISASKPSQHTLDETLQGPAPLATLKREYRSIVITTASLLALSFGIWAYFTINLAF